MPHRKHGKQFERLCANDLQLLPIDHQTIPSRRCSCAGHGIKSPFRGCFAPCGRMDAKAKSMATWMMFWQGMQSGWNSS